MIKRLLIINNIPTPYRTFMFDKMHEIGKEYGVEVQVVFLAENESKSRWWPTKPRRHWDYHAFSMGFPHYFARGCNIFSDKPVPLFCRLTINFGVFRELISSKYDYAIFAPSMSITNWLAAILPLKKTKKIMWQEANSDSQQLNGWPVRKFRKLMYAQYSALFCPGKRAIDYIYSISPKMASRPDFYMPNIVDTSLYVQQGRSFRKNRRMLRVQMGIPEDHVVILCVGRLEKSKGYDKVIELLPNIKGKYQLLIIGSGVMKSEYLQIINTLGLNEKVRLLGQQDQEEVVKYLACADWFFHPAIGDPSPLVCIEACTIGLPMSVSKQTGNAPEVVEDGVNGLLFDAKETDSIKNCLRRMVEASPSTLDSMGKMSMQIAGKRFDPDRVCKDFFEKLTSL